MAHRGLIAATVLRIGQSTKRDDGETISIANSGKYDDAITVDTQGGTDGSQMRELGGGKTLLTWKERDTTFSRHIFVSNIRVSAVTDSKW